jgi:hypothetical protein
VSESEGLPLFWELAPSPSSVYAGGLVAPKLMFKCPTLYRVYLHLAVTGWNVTPLLSGRSQKVVALGLGCLFLIVETQQTDYWLPCTT